MNRKFRYLALASVILMLSAIFNPSSAVAQTGAMSVAEFREKFTAYAIWLDNNTSSNQNLAMQVQAMTDEEFKVLYDSFADPDAFIAVTEKVMAPSSEALRLAAPELSTPLDSQSLVALPLPGYPSTNAWLTWVPSIFWTVPENSNWAQEGCPNETEANLLIAVDMAADAAVVAELACDLDFTKAIGCPAKFVANLASLQADILVNKCSYIGDAVDSAENHATYENSKIISGQVSTHDTEIKAILAANHTEVMDTLARNQAQLLKIEIEKELSVASDNKRLSYFYLPQAQGGLLELVRQTVLDTITTNQSAGMSLGNAQSWFNKAEASLAKGSYKTAYDLYKKAYLEAVK
jgi:hypothetical protein